MLITETARVIEWMRAMKYSDAEIIDLLLYVADGSDVTEEVEPQD